MKPVDRVQRRAVAKLLFLPLLLCSVWTVASASARGEQVLLADTGGTITEVAMSLNSARRAALRNTYLVGNVINTLDSVRHFHVIANDLAAFTVANNPWPERISFTELPPSTAITMWTQDPFLVLASPSGQEATLLTSREFGRAGDAAMAEYLAGEGEFNTRQSSLYFEGGNIVADESMAFIGANTIRHNALELDITEIDVVNRFQRELGKKVLVLGPVPQPVGHIDMAITPLGDGRIAVADAGRGLRIARQELEMSPETVRAFEQFAEAHFFGHPDINWVTGADGERIYPPDLEEGTQRLLEHNRAIAPVLDGIAAALGDFGYEVQRVPFFFGGPESREDPDDGVAAYPMLTYNNVLLETSGSRATVYLPRYGWAAMDDAAEAAWKGLGFVTAPVDGLTISAMYGGSLRCAVKVLRRR